MELKPEGADTEVRLFEVISRTAEGLSVVTDACPPFAVCVCLHKRCRYKCIQAAHSVKHTLPSDISTYSVCVHVFE